MLELYTEYAEPFVSAVQFRKSLEDAHTALDILMDGSGKGSDMRGWIELPNRISPKELAEYKRIAGEWKELMDVIVVIGIGGSYLGAKCALRAFGHTFSASGVRHAPNIVFAGYSLSEDYMADLLGFLKDKNYGLVVISKSGTTTEPAIAFRILKKAMEERFGKETAAKRIITVTDAAKGALREASDKYGYRSFAVPDDVGGRYSVLSAVGLLPIALGGFDIDSFIGGAKKAYGILTKNTVDNPAVRYAAMRNALYKSGKKIEVFINYHPKLRFLGEWLKQLFAESEGKEHKGLFPTTMDLTTDLHSVGQYIQDGERIMFETAVLAGSRNAVINVPKGDDNLDGLDYLVGKSLEEINRQAEKGTRMAHVSGEVPNIYMEMNKVDEWNMGQLFYFFETSCAISAYTLGLNPFDQPGVEVYKRNLYKLLGRPGYTD